MTNINRQRVVLLHLGTQPTLREGNSSKYYVDLLQIQAQFMCRTHCCQLIPTESRRTEREQNRKSEYWAPNIYIVHMRWFLFKGRICCFYTIVNNYAIYWHFTMTNWIFGLVVRNHFWSAAATNKVFSLQIVTFDPIYFLSIFEILIENVLVWLELPYLKEIVWKVI